MTERPDDLSFASPGPVAPSSDAGPTAGVPAGPTAGVPAGAPDHQAPADRTVAPPSGTVPYGERWGAPGGPTPAERAAARRQARRWVISVLLVIVLVVGLAAGISAVVSRAQERAWAPVTADVTEPTSVNAVQLVLGSCLSDAPGSGAVTTTEVVPCDEPHAAQVVGRTDSAPDALWPGDDAVARKAARGCTADLLGPTGREEVGDAVTFVVWAPTEDSWADGDRTGLCVARTVEPRSGSLLE